MSLAKVYKDTFKVIQKYVLHNLTQWICTSTNNHSTFSQHNYDIMLQQPGHWQSYWWGHSHWYDIQSTRKVLNKWSPMELKFPFTNALPLHLALHQRPQTLRGWTSVFWDFLLMMELAVDEKKNHSCLFLIPLQAGESLCKCLLNSNNSKQHQRDAVILNSINCQSPFKCWNIWALEFHPKELQMLIQKKKLPPFKRCQVTLYLRISSTNKIVKQYFMFVHRGKKTLRLHETHLMKVTSEQRYQPLPM